MTDEPSPLRRRYAGWDDEQQRNLRNTMSMMRAEAHRFGKKSTQYNVFLLSVWHGFSLEETAARLDIRTENARMARYRAEGYMDEHLGQWWRQA